MEPTKKSRHSKWLILLLLAALPILAYSGRGALKAWTVARLERQQLERWPALSEQQAVALVQSLAQSGSNLPLIVHALTDDRATVLAAAQQGLSSLIVQWERLPPSAAAPRVAELAECLASEIDNYPPESATFAKRLTERLMELPVGSPQLDEARFLAACETVLRRDLARTPPPMVAAAEAPATSEVQLPAATPPTPAAPRSPAAVSLSLSDDEPAPPVTEEREPDLVAPEPQIQTGLQRPLILDGAGSEAAVQPRQFLPPRAARITDGSPAGQDAIEER